MSGAEERELLELAAKAAGYTGRVEFNVSTGECFFAFDMSAQNPRGRSIWNPRHDDGDSLRLLVTLPIRFEFDKKHNTAIANGVLVEADDACCFDRNTAARWAIFRAAAAIGKAMP